MSNITVTHAASGVVTATVLRRELITPHMVRVTFGGPDLERFEFRGFDQWFRLAVPAHDDDRFDNLPRRYDLPGYVRYLTLPKATRPVIRNYTVRDFRTDPFELDVDFVVHGTDGVAAPWAAAAEPGEVVGFLDQGCGWKPVPSDWVLLVADETGLPAVAGVLRDLPRDTIGVAIIETFDARDRQPLDGPVGVDVRWVERAPGAEPGSSALPELRQLEFPTGTPYAFAVGESGLATGARRHLVAERSVPKRHVTFCGYWKRSAT